MIATTPMSEMTVELLDAELLELCRRMPNTENPRLNERCHYTSHADPNHHCLIGQWLAERGLGECPAPKAVASAERVLSMLSAPTAVCRQAQRWQAEADHPGTRWGDVPTHMGLEVVR